jgi:hypothetical protein
MGLILCTPMTKAEAVAGGQRGASLLGAAEPGRRGPGTFFTPIAAQDGGRLTRIG